MSLSLLNAIAADGNKAATPLKRVGQGYPQDFALTVTLAGSSVSSATTKVTIQGAIDGTNFRNIGSTTVATGASSATGIQHVVINNEPISQIRVNLASTTNSSSNATCVVTAEIGSL